MNYKEDFDDTNWQVIQVSEVDDKIISDLLDNINSDLSEEFFISFESLMKISREKNVLIRNAIEKLKETEDLRKIILDYLLRSNKDQTQDLIVSRLYNSDFIIRARTVLELADSHNSDYLKYVIPLLNDKDDSVRWAVIQYIEKNNLFTSPKIKKKLIERKDYEKNSIIKNKLNVLISEI